MHHRNYEPTQETRVVPNQLFLALTPTTGLLDPSSPFSPRNYKQRDDAERPRHSSSRMQHGLLVRSSPGAFPVVFACAPEATFVVWLHQLGSWVRPHFFGPTHLLPKNVLDKPLGGAADLPLSAGQEASSTNRDFAPKTFALSIVRFYSLETAKK